MIAEVNTLFKDISAQIKLQYPILEGWEIKWNKRLRTVMGRATRSANGKKRIELSAHIIHINKNSPNFLQKAKETILHEWAHALDWEFNKKWGHGPTWKSWMRKLGNTSGKMLRQQQVALRTKERQVGNQKRCKWQDLCIREAYHAKPYDRHLRQERKGWRSS